MSSHTYIPITSGMVVGAALALVIPGLDLGVGIAIGTAIGIAWGADRVSRRRSSSPACSTRAGSSRSNSTR